ncbi:MAG: NAD(P)/FAD-dependent oxidoreductase [Clostridia bacterium]|nr:NAD(P)/FAD-dependent oxidoreductase [Clostridia bacterium]
MANIAIVGGGVAGLSTGIYAQMNGHRATVYERHSRAGGNLTGWDRGGYHIDNCIHWLTGTNPLTSLYKMWKDLGALGDVALHRAETLYTFKKDGRQISLHRRIERVQEDMLRISPEDKREIFSFIRAVKALMRLNGIAGQENTEKSTLLQKVFAVPALLKYYNLTTGELAARFRHPLLQGFIKSFMTDGFSALALIMVFATFSSGNGDIPVGSSCAMAERMTARFLALGGTLRLRAGVAKINTAAGKAQSVTLEDGTVEEADYVVVATDPAVAFGKLLDKGLMPGPLAQQYADPKMRRFSSHHCAFGCDSADLPFQSDVLLEIPEKYKKELCANYLMVREFSHEKSFAPEGKNLLQTMIYCLEGDARSFIELHRDTEAYKARKKRMAAAIEEIVTDAFPVLRGKLQCIDVWTPATYQRYVDSEIGSFMSFIFPSGSLPRRLAASIDGLDNVFLATQWQQAPGGLPIAAGAGVDAVKAIMKKEKAV